MDLHWAEQLLKASKRTNEKEQNEFLHLVDHVFGRCDADVARILMKTFTDTPDYGMQERVISVLATADDAIVTRAILEELPRLVQEAPEWAESLIGLEVDKRPQLLVQVASSTSENVKQALKNLLAQEEFQDFYPGAKDVAF